ncbi:MAG: hypothetical protein HC828_05370 [Blastochloris sp.]|nr:hypothetical protein [Blastochloris sp.]
MTRSFHVARVGVRFSTVVYAAWSAERTVVYEAIRCSVGIKRRLIGAESERCYLSAPRPVVLHRPVCIAVEASCGPHTGWRSASQQGGSLGQGRRCCQLSTAQTHTSKGLTGIRTFPRLEAIGSSPELRLLLARRFTKGGTGRGSCRRSVFRLIFHGRFLAPFLGFVLTGQGRDQCE